MLRVQDPGLSEQTLAHLHVVQKVINQAKMDGLVTFAAQKAEAEVQWDKKKEIGRAHV